MKRLSLLALLLVVCFAISAQEKPRTLTWTKDASFADSVIQDGATIRLIRDNGLVIAVVGYDAKDHVICEVAVVNESDHRIDVLPDKFFLGYTDTKGKNQILLPLPGRELAGKYSSRAKWGNFFRAFAAGMARSTSTVSGDIYDSQGRVTYDGTITSPDVAAQLYAAEANREASAQASEKGARIIDRELRANTLFPKQYVQGMVYFRRKKMDTGLFFVVIDGTGYAFRFGGIK